MKALTSIELINDFNSVISKLKDSPVMICEQDKDIAALLFVAHYKELKKLEDILYEKSVELAIQEGFSLGREADDLLESVRDSLRFTEKWLFMDVFIKRT